MSKLNRFTAFVLSTAFLFNSTNYEVVVDAVSSEIQEFKEEQLQKSKERSGDSQSEITTTDVPVSTVVPEVMDLPETISDFNVTTVLETAEVTDITKGLEIATTEITTEVSVVTTNIVTSEAVTTTNQNTLNSDREAVSYENIWDANKAIDSYLECNKNTKVNGKLTLKENSTLHVKQNTVIEINGDLVIESGALLNSSENDIKIIVKGDVLVEGRLHISNSSIFVEGNVIEKGSSEIQGSGSIVLTGNKQQIIDTHSQINRIINRNTSTAPLVFINSLNFVMYEDNGNGITSFKKDDEGNYTNQKCPVQIDKRINFFVRDYSNGGNPITGKELVIHGDLNITSDVEVNIAQQETDNVTLRVKGNLNQDDGYLKTFNQKLIVEGNYNLNNGTLEIMGKDANLTVLGNMTIQGNSIFKMHYENSRVVVNGDFTVKNNRVNELRNGVLEIKGNFTQDQNESNLKLINEGYNIDSNNLHWVNNHKVILNGSGKQTITFRYPTLLNSDKSIKTRRSQFATLELTKSFYEYEFTNDLSTEKICENLLEPYSDDDFYKNQGEPYRIRKSLDIPLSHLELVNANDHIYAIGGKDENNAVRNEINKYNIEQNTWSTVGYLDTNRMDYAAVTVNNDIYVFGGYDGTNVLNSVEIISWNGTSHTVELDPNSSLISRKGHKAVYYNGKIYIIGGESEDGTPLNTLEVYNPETNTVELKKYMQNARKDFGASLYMDNDKFYIAVAGGENSDGILKSVEIYDFASEEWISKQDMLTARKGFSLEFLMGKLFAVGGISSENENGTTYLNTCEGFNGENWVDLKDDSGNSICASKSRGYFGSVAAYNSVFIAGGETPSVCDTFEQFMPLEIPGVRFKGNSKGLNGDFTQEETDLSFNSSIQNFSLTRVYNTQFKDEKSDFLGYGWKFNFESSIKEINNRAGKVNAIYLNVRKTPWGTIVGGIEKGTVVSIIGEVTDAYGNAWFKISGKDEECYYVYANYVTEIKNNNENKAVEVTYPDGIKTYFVRGEDGKFAANFGTYDKLELSGETYILTTKDQVKYTYLKDKDGLYRNSSVVDKYGNVITINYSSDRIIITNNAGEKITVEKTDGGVKATDKSGRVVNYTINDNNLTEVTDVLGLKTSYEYRDNNISKIDKTTKNGKITSCQVEYDKTGRIYKYTDADGNTSLNYYEDVYMDESNKVLGIAGDLRRCVVDPDGKETITKYSLVEKRPILSVDQDKGITKYRYEISYNGSYVDVTNLKDGDDLYKTYSEIVKGQHPTRETMTDSNSQTTVIDKDANGNIVKKTNPDGSYIDYKFDDKNNLIEETSKDNKSKVLSVTKYTYNEAGFLTEVKYGASGSTETYVYDNNANVKVKGLVTEKKTARSGSDEITTTYSYYEDGQIKSETTGTRITYYAYHYGLFDSDQEIKLNNKTITIDKPANEYEKGIFYVQVKLNPEGIIEITGYDQNFNPVRVTISNQDGSEKSTSLIVYDEYGRKIKDISPEVYSENSEIADKITDSCHTYKYSNTGMVIEETDAEKNTTSYKYDHAGNLLEQKGPGSITYSYEYDNLYRIIRKSYTDESGTKELESYSYERGDMNSPANKASKLTHTEYINGGNGLTTTTYLDYAGRETVSENDFRIIKKEYYADGNLKRERICEKSDESKSVSDILYFYNDRGMLETTLTGYKPGESYFISKKIYTLDGLPEYEIVYLDAQEINPDSPEWSEDAKANITKYEYDESGNVLTESTYTGNFSIADIASVKFALRTKYEYDIHKNTVTEKSDNIKTVYVNNYLGKTVTVKNIVKSTDLIASAAGTGEETALITENSYDRNGNLIRTKTPSGSVTEYSYDNLGRLTETKQLNVSSDDGIKTGTLTESLSYNWAGSVTRKVLTFDDIIKSESEYQYDSRNNLILSADKVDGKYAVTAYEYNRAGLLTAEASPESFAGISSEEPLSAETYSIATASGYTKYTYDDAGRLKTKEFVGNTYTLDEEKRIMTANEDEDSFVISAFEYDANDNLIKEIDGEEYGSENARGKAYTYSGTGNVLTVRYPESDIDNVISEYDALGNVTSEKVLKEISGAAKYALTTTEYSQDEDGITEYTQKTFSSDNETVSSVDQLISLKTWKTDINGNVIEETLGKKSVKTEYNSLGFESKSVTEADRYTENDKETVVNSEIKTLYDNEGNAVVIIRNSGIVEISKYDRLRRLVSRTTGRRPEGVADNKLSAEKLTDSVTLKWAYDAQGNVRFEYDGNGNITEYQYDELGRLVNTIKRYGTDKVSEDRMAYNLNGNLTEETTVLNNVQTGKKSYLYDGLGRVIQKSDVIHNSDGSEKTVPYEFIEYNKNSDQIKSYDAELVLKEFVYNADRQLTETKLAGITTEKLEYDYAGNVRSKTDGEGNKTLYAYDEMDRLVDVSVLKGETVTKLATYTYNAEGNVITKNAGENNIIHYTYTASDSIKEIITGEDKDVFFYNSDGLLEKSTDPNGNITTYTYTPQGLVSKEETKNSDDETIIREYTYDKNGNVLKSVVTENGKKNYIYREYDELSRVTKKEATDSVTCEYIYDYITEGNLVCDISRYDNGESSSNVYDEFGRLKYVYAEDISDGSVETEPTEYTYDKKSRRESIIYPNGAKSEYKYDSSNNITVLSNFVKDSEKKSGYRETEKYEYSYYANNALSGKTETFDGIEKGVITYEYDELIRLTSTKEERGGKNYRDISYEYDDAGNRSKEISVTEDGEEIKFYKYGTGNLLLGYTVISNGNKTNEVKYEYDKNGNLTSESTVFKNGEKLENDDITETQYRYNSLNQLVSSQTSELTVINEYNAEGLRISKEVISADEAKGVDTSVKTNYTYEYQEVIFETDSTEDYVWNVQGINLISRQINGEMFYCMYNAHADITRMVDENGELAEKYYYDEWGVETETLRYGDVTGDGSVNALDYMQLNKYCLGLITELTVEQRIAADMNGDGTLDAEDADILKQIILVSLKHCPADTNKDGFINEKNNKKYAGYFYDGETGLYYLNARFYDPETARFIQEDTYSGILNDPLSLNLYTYGQNNPISYYDPTGHSIKSLIKKATDTVKKTVSKVTSSVKKTVTSTASTVKKAATTTKNAVVSASKEFRSDWQSGIDQLKSSGTAGKIFASYSEGVVHNLDNTVAGTVQLVKDPLGTVSESVNYFLADPLRNNPIAAAGTFCRDTAQAVYSKDWETVANKVGSGTATVAVMGITGTLAEGAAGKIFSKGISIDKSISLPMLEMYKYAGAGGFELGGSTVSIPIKASVSASKVATAAGVTASAAAGQGIYYSNKFYNQSSGGGNSQSLIKNNSVNQLAKPGEDLYVGTYSKSRYGNLKTGLNTTHTPHHVVQDAISETTHGKGITINIRKDLHELTGTYKKTRDIDPTDLRGNLATDIWELRGILRDAGYDRNVVNTQLHELIRQNKLNGDFKK